MSRALGRQWYVVLVGVAVAFLSVSCGGGGDDESDVITPPAECSITVLRPGAGYQVRVSRLGDPDCGDTGGEFVMFDSSGCEISAMAGHEGSPDDPVDIGEEVHIFFESSGLGSVDIELWYHYGYNDLGLVGPILEDYSGPSPYVWHASTLGWVVQGRYLFKVKDSFIPNCERFTNVIVMNP